MASKRKAFAAIEYPANCRELSDDLTKDELVKRLKMLALAFQKMGQEDSHAQYSLLALHLASDTFLEHSSKDVKLLVSCCIADVFRIFAPDAPYTDSEQLKEIFLFLARQLYGLQDVSSPYFKRYFYLLENLALVKSFNICLELEESQEVITSLLKTIFEVISADHTAKVKNYFLDIMSSLVTEADTLSVQVLDSILCNLVEQKEEQANKAAYELAADLVRRTSKALEPHISRFFNNILVLGKTSESNMSNKTVELIEELHHIAPNVLLTVMPQLEFKLKSNSEKERKNVVKVLGSLFSEPTSDLISVNAPLWHSFLGRFNDIHPEVRMKCVECSRDLLINQPISKKDITCEFAHRQHDTDDSIRLEVVSVVVAAAKKGLEYVNDELLAFVKERCLDKKPKVRCEALAGLGALYRKYSRCEPAPDGAKHEGASNGDAASADVTWMQDCILHAYYRPLIEDKLEVEKLLYTELVPFSLAPEEHVKQLLRVYATIDENSVKALHEIFKCQSIMRKLAREWTDIVVSDDPGEHHSQALQSKCAYLARCLPDSAKAAEELKALARTLAGSAKLRQHLQRLLGTSCPCREAEDLARQILQHVRGSETGGGGHACSGLKHLLERIAPWFLDREAALALVRLVVDGDVAASLRRCIMAARSTVTSATSAAETAPKLLVALSTFFPELFDSSEVFSQLAEHLKHSDDFVSDATLRVIVNIGCQVKTTYPTIYENMLPTLLSLARTGTAKQTKHALLCISTICPATDKSEIFTSIFEHAKKCLSSGASSHALTAVIAAGHVVALCPDAPYTADMKSLVSDALVKGILMQDKTPGRKVNDVWYADHLVTEETSCKVAAMKAIVRWLIATKDKQPPAEAGSSKAVPHVLSTLRMLHTLIIHNGDLMGKGSINKPEMARLRLEAGCCVLRIAQQPLYAEVVTNQHFQSLALLINDACYEVRLRFTLKLQKYLLLMKLPLQYLAILSLAANDPVKERRVQVKQFIDTNVQNRRKYIKTHPPSSNAVLFNILPDYVLPYTVHLLAHDPDLKTHDNVDALKNIKECLWSVMEPLIRDQSSVCSLHRKIFEHIKQTKDNQNPEDGEANKKLYVICDVGLALLQKKAACSISAMASDSCDPLLPAKLFTKVDKSFNNTQVYLPKDVMTAPIRAEKMKTAAATAATKAASGSSAAGQDAGGGGSAAAKAASSVDDGGERSSLNSSSETEDRSSSGSDEEGGGAASAAKSCKGAAAGRRGRRALPQSADAEKPASGSSAAANQARRKRGARELQMEGDERASSSGGLNTKVRVTHEQAAAAERDEAVADLTADTDDDAGKSSTSSSSPMAARPGRVKDARPGRVKDDREEVRSVGGRRSAAASRAATVEDNGDSDVSASETQSNGAGAPATPVRGGGGGGRRAKQTMEAVDARSAGGRTRASAPTAAAAAGRSSGRRRAYPDATAAALAANGGSVDGDPLDGKENVGKRRRAAIGGASEAAGGGGSAASGEQPAHDDAPSPRLRAKLPSVSVSTSKRAAAAAAAHGRDVRDGESARAKRRGRVE